MTSSDGTGSAGPGCAPTGASLLHVPAICGQALCAIPVATRFGHIGNQVVRFDSYAAHR